MIIGKSITALGGGGLKPEIRVTAKAGALLNLHYKDSTIILQSYQLGAEETQHTFVVSVSETAYVVDDMTNVASVEALVDAVAVFEAEIKYALWLYREGDERIDVTGGWTDSGYSSNESIYTVLPASKQSGYVLFKTNGLARIFALGTINKINLTGYKKMYVDLDNTYTNIGAIYTLFGRVASDKILYTDEQYSLANTTGRQVVSVDISSIEGNNYIMFYLFGYSGNGNKYASTNLYNVWLE